MGWHEHLMVRRQGVIDTHRSVGSWQGQGEAMHGGLVVVCVTLVELVGVNNTTQASGAGRGGWLWPNQHTTKHQPRAESATTSTHCQDGVVADVCLMDEAVVVVVAVHGTLPPHHHHAEVVPCDHVCWCCLWVVVCV